MATAAMQQLGHGSCCTVSNASRGLAGDDGRNLASTMSFRLGRAKVPMHVAQCFCSTSHGRRRGRPARRSHTQAIAVTEISVSDSVGLASSHCTRRLILLRHADSSWADRSIKDHLRPLTEQGRQAAAGIASKLWCRGLFPDLILCSDSIRTRETLQVMQQHVGELVKAQVYFLASFYSVSAMDGHTAEHLQRSILDYSSDDMKTVMCMGHNRGWEEAASVLSGIPVELKTANAAVLEANGSSWQEAFELAGQGGWTLIDVVKPDLGDDSEDVII